MLYRHYIAASPFFVSKKAPFHQSVGVAVKSAEFNN